MTCVNCLRYQERHIIDQENDDDYYNIKRSNLEINFLDPSIVDNKDVELRAFTTIVRGEDEMDLQGIKLNELLLYPLDSTVKTLEVNDDVVKEVLEANVISLELTSEKKCPKSFIKETKGSHILL